MTQSLFLTKCVIANYSFSVRAKKQTCRFQKFCLTLSQLYSPISDRNEMFIVWWSWHLVSVAKMNVFRSACPIMVPISKIICSKFRCFFRLFIKMPFLEIKPHTVAEDSCDRTNPALAKYWHVMKYCAPEILYFKIKSSKVFMRH